MAGGMTKARAYYNEFDPFAAAWLRELIFFGYIADGDVDERSIEDVTPDDLRGYTQCHFFAGIGVWSYALRNAGWPDDRPIWTGSCPCQPFSAAGKGGGFDDERHLWPAFFHLIQQCNPPVIVGEQVASKDGLAWLDLVRADLEGTGRAFAAADLCAAGVGAPHIRQRSWWLADAVNDGQRQYGRRLDQATGACEEGSRQRKRLRVDLADGGAADRLGDDDDARLEGHDRHGDDGDQSRRVGAQPAGSGRAASGAGGLGDTGGSAGERDAGALSGAQTGEHGARIGVDGCVPVGPEYAGAGVDGRQSSPTNGFWRDADWLYCRDGKWRPVEPGTFPLAHGAANRVGRLRGYGNAIVAPVAQIFIESVMDVLP